MAFICHSHRKTANPSTSQSSRCTVVGGPRAEEFPLANDAWAIPSCWHLLSHSEKHLPLHLSFLSLSPVKVVERETLGSRRQAETSCPQVPECGREAFLLSTPWVVYKGGWLQGFTGNVNSLIFSLSFVGHGNLLSIRGSFIYLFIFACSHFLLLFPSSDFFFSKSTPVV